MTVGNVWSAVLFAAGIVVRTSGNAAVGVVTKLVDVETMKAGLETLNFAGDLYGVALEGKKLN